MVYIADKTGITHYNTHTQMGICGSTGGSLSRFQVCGWTGWFWLASLHVPISFIIHTSIYHTRSPQSTLTIRERERERGE
jgi:hypothetical protein